MGNHRKSPEITVDACTGIGSDAPVPRRADILVHLAVITALIFGTGAHWFMLQSVAWARMFVSFSQEAPLVEAFEKTFDGENPCELCNHIRKTEKKTGQEKSPQPEFHLVGVLPPGRIALAPASAPFSYPRFEKSALARASAPPTPPPRQA